MKRGAGWRSSGAADAIRGRAQVSTGRRRGPGSSVIRSRESCIKRLLMSPSGPLPVSPERAADPIRVMIAKVGLGGHDRGAKVVARTLRDAGMDVIYTGLHRTPDEVVTAATQEDVDVLGISILSGAHMTLVPKVMNLMKTADASDIFVVIGGVFPDEDVDQLKRLGVAEVVGQDAPPETIVTVIRDLVSLRQPR